MGYNNYFTSYEAYEEDINRIEDLDPETLDDYAIRAKTESKYRQLLMKHLLKTVLLTAKGICRGYYEYLGGIVNTWVLKYLPKYVENYKPERGHFFYYIRKHMRKELYQIFLEILPGDRVNISKYNASKRDFIQRELEIKEQVEKIKKDWRQIDWNSDLYRTLYCTLHSFLPELTVDDGRMDIFCRCYENPEECFDEYIISEITQDHRKLINNYKPVCEILNQLLQKGYPPGEIKEWDQGRTADRVRNFKNWLIDKLGIK